MSVLEILGKAPAPTKPGECALDHPTAWQNDEAVCRVRPLDDLDLHLCQELRHALLEDRSLVAAIGKHLAQKGIEAEQF